MQIESNGVPLTPLNAVQIQAQINALTDQRNAALNESVNKSGEIGELNRQIDVMRQQIASRDTEFIALNNAYHILETDIETLKNPAPQQAQDQAQDSDTE